MDVATLDAFRANPQFVWDLHVQLAGAIRRARPNAVHSAVAELQKQIERVTVITQNMDNLHQDAGSVEFIELR